MGSLRDVLRYATILWSGFSVSGRRFVDAVQGLGIRQLSLLWHPDYDPMKEMNILSWQRRAGPLEDDTSGGKGKGVAENRDNASGSEPPAKDDEGKGQRVPGLFHANTGINKPLIRPIQDAYREVGNKIKYPAWQIYPKLLKAVGQAYHFNH
ncbi:hypothetical protein AAL_08235 [Moelleriella libera RCEF 2490]|uniref:Uncharacterized protein n=1 Tax=Moelleriella libera RCEF 2490 TaxID=1081109 RepID=A0A167VRJ1_9HYPO|nr:hypothetical protein AAL_08235 [Moelleriella libera RCEF 2490]